MMLCSSLSRGLLRRLGSSRVARAVSTGTVSREAAEANTATQNSISPLDQPDFFGVHKLFNVKDLFDARVHLGHTPRALTDTMRPFVFGSRFDTSVIDLDQTASMLRRALNFLAHLAANGGIVLFVCRQPQLVHVVERTAVECGEYAMCRAWNSDLLLNAKEAFQQEVRLPDVIVLLHTRDGQKYIEHPAVAEAAKQSIPTIGIVDTDCEPNLITYPIPGNDDTPASIQLYCHLFKEAILLGKKHRDAVVGKQATKAREEPSS